MPTSNPSEADRPPKPESNAARLSSSLVRLVPGEDDVQTSPDDRLTIIGPKVASFPSPHVVLNAGVRLGQYEIVEAIGSGGMATVLKARDTDLGRDVALKILPPEAARDPDAVARFKLEARSAAKLDHEYVARVFSCGEDRGLHFIAFEFVEGVTLRDEIDRLGTVPATDCVRYMSHLAAGLQHAADRGVVHRDVKPSNIIITPDGRAKIIDMGLARQMDLHSVNGGVTQSGVTLGTFDYISPEQALDPRRADVRSDLYSLGCAFYHALTGRPPVPEGTAAKKLQAHQHEAPIDPRELNPAVPDDVAIVLSKLMMKDPAKRYQTPLELIADLTAISATWKLPLEGSAIHPVLPYSDRPLPSVLRSAELPRMPIGLLVGLAAMVLAGLVIFGSLGGKPSPYLGNEFASSTTKPAAFTDVPPPGPSVPSPSVAPGATLENVAELIHAFESSTVSAKLVPGHVYDLSATPGVLFQGKDLLLECADPTKPATIRIAASPVKKFDELRAGTLTIARAASVTLHGVLIEVVEKPGTDEEEKAAPVGLMITDAGKVEFAECRVELDATANSAFGTGIRLVRTERTPAMAVTVKHCLFDLRRWAALELGEGLTATIRETGFATAETAIRFSEDLEPPDLPVTLSLQHCTFMLENRAAAIDVRKGAGGTVSSGFCVYGSTLGAGSVMMMAENGDRKPTVLRVAEGAEAVSFTSEPEMPNAFYRVVVPTGAGEKDSELKQPPWAVVAPQGKLLTAEPWKAFELNPSMMALRVSAPKDVYLLGVKRLPMASSKTGVYDNWPPAGSAVDAPPPGFKVWWPNPPADKRELLPANGVYASLAEALAAVKRDDVLLIRGEGTIEVPNLPALSKADLRLTIRPEDDKATIVLVPVEAPRADSSLFRLEDGELVLERLQFRLRPKPAEAADLRSQAIVSMAGGKRCEFHQCAITLDEQAAEKLAAVSIVDVAGQMRKPDATRRPLVRMDNCMVRGKGRALWAAAAIPCDLSMTNCIVALTGPVLDFDAPTKAPASGAIVGVNLVHVTALLNAPFLEMDTVAGSDEKPGIAVPVEVRAEGCLFAAHASAKPTLVRILQADPAMWDRYFTWQTLGPNGYANWPETATLYELTGEPSSSESKKLDGAAWLAFTKEKPDAMGKVKWSQPLPDAALKPQDFETAETPWKDEVGAKRVTVAVPSDE